MKGPTEKHFDGIYANPRLMHAIGQVVGCIVLVQVKSGSLYEGVLKTISNRADFVLEMARRVENIKSLNSDAPAVGLISNQDKIYDKLVFKVEDIVSVNATNIDPEYATRENFTDTAISKFNGQVVEKELEPWDGGVSSDGLPDLGGSGEEEANGWDANDMFRTNEEKYGVKSNFDSTLPGYTIPLNKQNTEEYKQQEAKASKIAQEIESSLHHRNRAALENGDEEDKYSAVHRPDNNANNFRYVSHRSKKGPSRNNVRNNPPPPHMNRNSHHHSQGFHNRVSSPASALNNSQGSYKVVNSVPSPNCVNTISPRPTPTSTPPTSRQPAMPAAPLQQQPPLPAPVQFQQVSPPNAAVGIAQAAARATPPTTPTMPAEESHKMNGETDKAEIKYAPKPPRSLNLQTAANKEMRDSVANQQVLNKNMERRKDIDKKTPVQKSRDDKTEDLKRFHARFKLSEDNKESHEKDTSKSDSQSAVSSVSQLSSKHHNKEKNKEEEGSRKMANTPESRTSPENPKNSNLNPNAKEFVLNPNAKTFTPRVNLSNAPPPVQPRLHTQSPIMVPQPHIMPGMAQTVFNMAPHYVVSTGPGSVPMTPSFPPAASVTQPPRFRKGMPMPLTLQRHDLSQPVHVQAATGQPILAQPALSAAPQFAIQYAPSPGMLHPPPGPPQPLAYTQMYSIMPRVLTQQPVGMVPTSAAYGDNSQIPTHVYMPHPGTPGLQHPMASANSGQHSAPSTPQSQTPNLHPAPSPVHQPPPTGGHGQPPTPTGHPSNAPTPQPVMYTHGHMATQHPMHGNHSSSNQAHPFASYPGTAQPIVLLPQQHHGPHAAAFAPSLQNHLHGQNPASHVGTPTHVLPHGPLTMIPTSAGMVHTQTAISTGHYVPHTQGRSANNSSIHAKRKLHRTKNN